MNEKNFQKSLGAMVRADIADAFSRECARFGPRNKQAVEAAAKLWLCLPKEWRMAVIDAEPGDVFGLLQRFFAEHTEKSIWSNLSADQRKALSVLITKAGKIVEEK